MLLTTATNTMLATNALNVYNIEDDIQASSNTTSCNMEQCDRYDTPDSNSTTCDTNINNMIKDFANVHEDALTVNEDGNIFSHNNNDVTNGKFSIYKAKFVMRSGKGEYEVKISK